MGAGLPSDAAARHGAKDLIDSTLGRGHAAFEEDFPVFVQNAITADAIP